MVRCEARRSGRRRASHNSYRGGHCDRSIEDRLRRWFAEKESQLEALYAASPLRPRPDEAALKALLLQCLEEHYGSLAGCVVEPDRAVAALRGIQAELDRVRDLL